MISYQELLIRAWEKTLSDYQKYVVMFWSEADIQSYIFHKAVSLSDDFGFKKPYKIHVETTCHGFKPDLVLGDEEVIVELKLTRVGTGGYTGQLEQYKSDVEKLKRIKQGTGSIVYFVAIDETGYHANPQRKNYFDPKEHGLKSDWHSLGDNRYVLFSEV